MIFNPAADGVRNRLIKCRKNLSAGLSCIAINGPFTDTFVFYREKPKCIEVKSA